MISKSYYSESLWPERFLQAPPFKTGSFT